MMEFDDIVVKESPGLCRCCLSEGCYKDLGTEYTWMNDTEVYADMLLECFDISITQQNEGPNGPNRLICEVCITRLRDACNFKKQVLDSEKKFIDMLGRGEFRPKMVIYQAQMKSEHTVEEATIEEADVEYLEDDIDFGDDEIVKDEMVRPSVSDITVSTLPVKGKRGRPRKQTVVEKAEKPEKRIKAGEDKPKTSKPTSKDRATTQNEEETYEYQEDITKNERHFATKHYKTTSYNSPAHLYNVRANVTRVLENSTVMPFRWLKNKFRCFYCYDIFQEPGELKIHQQIHTVEEIEMKMRVFFDDAVFVDVSDIACKLCPEEIKDLDCLIDHLSIKHDVEFNDDVGIAINEFKLNDVTATCVVCDETFETFGRLLSHTNKFHKGLPHLLCDTCGSYFESMARLKKHISKAHDTKTVKCTLCDIQIPSTTVQTHLQKFHGKRYKCFECEEVFETLYKRKHHMMAEHEKDEGYKCPHCPLVFVFPSIMIRHVKKEHMQEKNATCGICGWQTFEVGRLERHMTKHSKERNFSCTACGKSFKTRETMMEHHKNIHLKVKRKK